MVKKACPGRSDVLFFGSYQMVIVNSACMVGAKNTRKSLQLGKPKPHLSGGKRQQKTPQELIKKETLFHGELQNVSQKT